MTYDSQFDELLAQAKREEAERAAKMPTEQAALDAMFEARWRLCELGWRDIMYCPKDGTLFEAIEAGSTGIHKCYYEGEWPDGRWWIIDDDDIYPSSPILWRPLPKPDGAADVIALDAKSRLARRKGTNV